MDTYLIFFGESQDFTFHAFNEKGYVSDFNSIIKDFNMLASEYFTIDDLKNKEILSKYNFEVAHECYSLLKLYSLAQACKGRRIDGSIYGVALLSSNDLPFSKININLLNEEKVAFKQRCLNGLKFKMSDFYDEVAKIWTEFKDKKYFTQISYKGLPVLSGNPLPHGYWVNSLYDNAPELNDEMSTTDKIYVSEDLEHLKRTNRKWGDNRFPVYYKKDGVYVLYKKVKTLPSWPEQPLIEDDDEKIIAVLKSDLREERMRNERLSDSIIEISRKAKIKIRLFACTTAACFIIATANFFGGHLFMNKISPSETKTSSSDMTETNQNQSSRQDEKQPVDNNGSQGGNATTSKEDTGRRTYVVKQGDGLKKIANNNSIALDSLLKWNNLKTTETIHPGNSLYIEPPK
jgi:LysM repeat protein